MVRRSFVGGIHPSGDKDLTENSAIIAIDLPEIVTIPLSQHIGAPSKAVVSVGDSVEVGQVIGEAVGFVSVPVHSSVSGKVKKLEDMVLASGRVCTVVVIESDGENRIAGTVKPVADVDGLSQEKIREIIKNAGIVGLGGATFPTHVKLTPPTDKRIETVILNGCECEPYLTSDYRVMLERSEDVIFGLKMIMCATGATQGYIGIEDNKPDAIDVLSEYASLETGVGIEVVALETKYPQGGEKQLISAILGREVPSGGLPLDVGVVVNNVSTAVAVADAIKRGMPLVERVVTVAGTCIKEPQNVLVRIGTPLSLLIDACGGLTCEPGKVVLGGPMMGISISSLELPVTKGTSGVLVLSKVEARGLKKSPCIRCGKCVDVCPMKLSPGEISHFVEYGELDKADLYGVMDCIECGSCAYVCPGKRDMVQWIRLGKAELAAKKRSKAI